MPEIPNHLLLELVRALANQRVDGDIINGEEWEADGNDDEVDALYMFVGWARRLLGAKKDD